jgi:hypothetical protein
MLGNGSVSTFPRKGKDAVTVELLEAVISSVRPELQWDTLVSSRELDDSLVR